MSTTTDTAREQFGAGIAGDAESMGERAKKAAEEAIAGVKDRAADYLEQGRDKTGDMAAAVEDQIRGRPLPAIAIAAALGFGIGFLWMRRS